MPVAVARLATTDFTGIAAQGDANQFTHSAETGTMMDSVSNALRAINLNNQFVLQLFNRQSPQIISTTQDHPIKAPQAHHKQETMEQHPLEVLQQALVVGHPK